MQNYSPKGLFIPMSFESIKSDIQWLTLLLLVLAHKLLCCISRWVLCSLNDWLESSKCSLKVFNPSLPPQSAQQLAPSSFWMIECCHSYWVSFLWHYFFLRVQTEEEKIQPALLIKKSHHHLELSGVNVWVSNKETCLCYQEGWLRCPTVQS